MIKILFVLLLFSATNSNFAQNVSTGTHSPLPKTEILPAAYRTAVYLPLLKGKRVGVFANHTATISNSHLVDTLVSLGIRITKAFGPEHGFRGTADAGEKIDNYIDPVTGIPVISLYGKKRKPSPEDLADVDIDRKSVV